MMSFVIGWTEIAEFSFELLVSDMTVIPQQYTLHCVTIAHHGYNITLYYEDKQIYHGGPLVGYSSRKLLYSSNGTYDNHITITWDTETISSGSFDQSVNDDQMYTCNVYVIFNNVLRVYRTRYLTIKGMLYS